MARQYERSFSLETDDSPWADPDFTNVTNQLDLKSGNIVAGDSSDWGRVVYDGEDVDTSADVITIEVTLGIGALEYSDIGGPAYLTSGGLGYVATQGGNTVSVKTVSTINTVGAKMNGDAAGGWVDPGGNIPGGAVTGGKLALQLYDLQSSPRIRCLYDGVVFGGDQGIDDTANYISTGRPGISQFWGDNQLRGFTAIAIDGLDLGGFSLTDINGTGVIQNNDAIVINGDFASTTITSVTLSQSGATDEVITSITETDTQLTLAAIDFHTTDFMDGELTVTVTDGTTAIPISATLDFSDDWLVDTAVSVDSTGMWKDIAGAEVGDISHWPKTIGGSPVTVDADGMLASLVPSIPNGSTFTAWHGAANVWTRIDGTINQDYGNTAPSWDAFTPWEVVFESVSTYDASVYATASAGTITYAIAAGVAGFSVAPSTGIITYDGTVAPGVYWLTLEGTDSNGASLSPELQVSVGSQQMGLITSRITAISQTQATITVDAKTAEGDIHIAVRDSGPYTSTADVKAAVGAVYDQDRPGAFTVPFYATGLTAGTFYYIGLVQVVDGEDSNLLTNTFTTQADIVYDRMGKVPVTRP